MVNLLGGRSRPGDFAPYYREPRPAGPAPAPRGGGLAAAFRFLGEVFPDARRRPQ